MIVPCAILASQLAPAGSPGTGNVGGLIAGVLIGLPLIGAVMLGVAYWRVRRAIRTREIAPPLYLLSYIESSSRDKAPPDPAPDVDPDDLETDEARSVELAALRGRGRFLLTALAADILVVWVAAGWVVRSNETRAASPSAPVYAVNEPPPGLLPPALARELDADTSAASLPANDVGANPSTEGSPEPPPVRRPETRRVAPPPASAPRTSPAPEDTKAVTSAAAKVPASAADSGGIAAPRDTVAVEPAATPPAIPAAPRVPDSAATPPAPRVDPALERALAEEALGASVRHVVQEVNARTGPSMASANAAGLRRLADWVRTNRPAATAGGLSDIRVDAGRAEAAFFLSLRWRDDFGVSKQRSIRLRITMRRERTDWLYAGTELLERFP